MAPTILVGHYGSGKTEFAANYAVYLQQMGITPIIADLDIVNPYFRLREKNKHYSKMGIKVISSYYPGEHHLDAPALTADLRYCFETSENSVIDVGGDENGARVLACYAQYLKKRPYNMWMVVNANRPKTTNIEDVIAHIKTIESASCLRINGLVNTTHMMGETTREDLIKGDKLVHAVAQAEGIPVLFTAYLKELATELDGVEFTGERFPMRLKVRPSWL